MQYDYLGKTYMIELKPGPADAYTATIGDQTFSVVARQLPDGGWQLIINGQRLTAYSAAQANSRHVALNGTTYMLTVSDTRTRRRSNRSDGDISAQMPGQVREVLVKVGDTVTMGQTLIILEAMKMEIRSVAPFDGTVTAVFAEPEAVIERGQQLIEVVEA